MIQFDNLSKRYPTGDEALSNINLHIDAGELAFLTGHSGAGKSTMLKLLMLVMALMNIQHRHYLTHTQLEKN